MIKECMNTEVYVVTPQETIARARNLMLKHGIGRLIVIEDDEPIGIVTKGDFAKRISQAEPIWRRRPIDDIPVEIVMTEKPLTILHEASAAQAAEMMLENSISGMPVVKEENGREKLVGIVTKQDLIRYYSDKTYDTKVGDIMETYIVTVNRHHTIDHVLYEMEENMVSTVVVIDEGDPIGLVSPDSIVFADFFHGDSPEKEVKMARKDTAGGVRKYRYVREVPLVAEDIMLPLERTITSDTLAVDAAKLMISTKTKSLLVFDDTLIGIVESNNILNEIVKKDTMKV